MTLTANPRWWGRPAGTRVIEIHFLTAQEMVQSLGDGRIDAMDPQPQQELVRQLESLGAAATVATSDQFTFEHLDYSFRGVFRNRDLRVALAKCLPRQQIVDDLIKPLNRDAAVLASRLLLPFQPAYPQFASSTGGSAYSAVDVAGAKRLVQASGVKGPIQVRIGWRKDPASLTLRRVETIARIRASCAAAGFDVIDAGTPDFFVRGLPDGNFDLALFGWTGSPLVHQTAERYVTGGPLNAGGYSSTAVDAAFGRLLQEIDPDRRTALLRQIDTLLWTDLQSVPLFALPALVATGPTVRGVRFNPSRPGLTWNAFDWSVGAGVRPGPDQTEVPTSRPTP